MKTALFYGGRDIRVEERPIPEPGAGEVLVRVRAAGVCGSDLHNYRGHRPTSSAAPWQQGHELAGEVAALGSGVSGLSMGQRVAIEAEHLLGCGRCRWCADGQSHICPERGMRNGVKQSSHGFSQYDVCVANNLHPITDAIIFDHAALLDCYACGVHAANRSPVPDGGAAVIIGAGAIAMTLGQVLRARGADQVVMIGTRPEPLETAVKSGAADRTICLAGQDPLKGVLSLTDGDGAAVTFETVGGRSQLISQAAGMTRRGGTVSVLGLFTAPQEIDSGLAMQKEITIRWSNSFSSWRGQSEFVTALGLMEKNRLNPGPIITHHFGIDDIGKAFAAADDKATSGAIRVMVNP